MSAEQSWLALHPLIKGLLQELPPEDEPFPEAQRELWLIAVAATLEVMYER